MYDPRVKGKRLHFAISGRLYQSTVLFYDRESNSLWSQLSAQAVSGPHAGTTLKKLPYVDTTWGDWKRQHPDTLVLSRDTGHRRPYGENPYRRYVQDLPRRGPMFPVAHRDGRLALNAPVFGIEVGGATKAYPVEALRRAPARFTDVAGGRTLTFINEPAGTLRAVHTADGTAVPAVRVLWFAWAAFHPDTTVYDETAAAP